MRQGLSDFNSHLSFIPSRSTTPCSRNWRLSSFWCRDVDDKQPLTALYYLFCFDRSQEGTPGGSHPSTSLLSSSHEHYSIDPQDQVYEGVQHPSVEHAKMLNTRHATTRSSIRLCRKQAINWRSASHHSPRPQDL